MIDNLVLWMTTSCSHIMVPVDKMKDMFHRVCQVAAPGTKLLFMIALYYISAVPEGP